MCRSRREVSNEYLVAIIGFDTEENEPCKVCPLSVYRSPRFGTDARGSLSHIENAAVAHSLIERTEVAASGRQSVGGSWEERSVANHVQNATENNSCWLLLAAAAGC